MSTARASTEMRPPGHYERKTSCNTTYLLRKYSKMPRKPRNFRQTALMLPLGHVPKHAVTCVILSKLA